MNQHLANDYLEVVKTALTKEGHSESRIEGELLAHLIAYTETMGFVWDDPDFAARLCGYSCQFDMEMSSLGFDKPDPHSDRWIDYYLCEVKKSQGIIIGWYTKY